MYSQDRPQFWILCLDPNFCTVDDLRMDRHGCVYDNVPHSIGVKEGDIGILFDSSARLFKTLGRFLSSVGVGGLMDGGKVRHDFLLKVTHKTNSSVKLVDLRKKLRLADHPVSQKAWLTQSFTKLKNSDFDQLMEAWWGVTDLSLELSASTGQQQNPPEHQKYLSYMFAFRRMEEAIASGFFLEASTIAESVILDRLLSACNRTGATSAKLPLSRLIDLAITLNPAVPTPEILHDWRLARHEVIHLVAKSAPGKSTLKVSEFMKLAESTAVDGLKLARIIAAWSKKVPAASPVERTLLAKGSQ